MIQYLQGLAWVIEGIFFVFLALATLYIFIYAVAGIFYRQKRLDTVSKVRKFAVLIPGYKEDSVIVHVAKQATLQDYPKDKYEVIVIADSFQPQTLEALKRFPIRVVEVSFEVSKKSKALNQCMKVIGDDYDVAFILDADNIMEQDVLSKINAAFDKGYSAVQGHRTAKNLNSSFAILDAVSEEINNHIFRKGHRVLGISSALIGSGMGLNYKLFKETMATVDSVGEDKEVELKIIKQGYTIDYVHDAVIYDEKTQRSDAFVNQRRRWLAAQLNYFRTHFADGLKELILRGNFDYFDKVIQMVQPPRILLSGVLFLIFVFTALIEFIPIKILDTWVFPGFYAWLILFLGAAVSIGLSVPKRLYNKKTFRALLSLPYGFILMFISLLKFRGAMQKFLHTEHSHVDEDQKEKKS
ncbi:MAG: glycosyltransferase family 2 protein [Bacteroidales bacterium]|nr:glycosyltransferase family 2 protein [Bacteroidales bacterium]